MTLSTHLYEGSNIIPLADIQHIEGHRGATAGLVIVMKSTRWSFAEGNWENNVWIPEDEMEQFLEAYRTFIQWRKVNE